jgi:CarboxypepD_reg-like domain
MNLSVRARVATLAITYGLVAGITQAQGNPQALAPASRQSTQTVRVAGVVRDEVNAIALPGVPVEVVETKEVVYTDVDGRYLLSLPQGPHTIRVMLDGYQEKTITVTAGAQRDITLDVGLTMNRLTETVTVTAKAIDVETSSAEAQLVERKQAIVITDNMGSAQMRSNGDSNAAAAMTRVTGLSVVDNQYIFVRGLGERYSNTTRRWCHWTCFPRASSTACR